jgi:hypothetical protein
MVSKLGRAKKIRDLTLNRYAIYLVKEAAFIIDRTDSLIAKPY